MLSGFGSEFGICFTEGGAKPSSLFLSEVLVLTLSLLNCLKKKIQRTGSENCIQS